MTYNYSEPGPFDFLHIHPFEIPEACPANRNPGRSSAPSTWPADEESMEWA